MSLSSKTKQTKLSSFFSPLRQHTDNILADMPPKRKCGTSSTPDNSKKPRTQENTRTPSPSKRSPRKAAAKTDSLDTQTKGLIRSDWFGRSWLPTLKKEFRKPYFEKLSSFVEKERSKHTVYPKAEDVFLWTKACKLQDVKVVILGQDPYHGPNQAHGLCFSVLPTVAIPPSLQNMYKELSTDIPGFQSPDHGFLQGWANQGVLLLNAVLTVRAREANSHKNQGWEQLTDAVIQHLNQNSKNLVFLLWGSYAQKKGAHINKEKHHVLTGVHPSPLSAHRGFFGCKHFSQANAYLESHGKTAVDWNRVSDKN